MLDPSRNPKRVSKRAYKAGWHASLHRAARFKRAQVSGKSAGRMTRGTVIPGLLGRNHVKEKLEGKF